MNKEQKTIIKIGILKQFAWEDGVFDEKEFKFITNYIAKNNKLECDIKVMLINDLNEKPPLISKFTKPILNFFNSNKNFFECDEEKYGFISTLERLLEITDTTHKNEIKFIDNLKKI